MSTFSSDINWGIIEFILSIILKIHHVFSTLITSCIYIVILWCFLWRTRGAKQSKEENGMVLNSRSVWDSLILYVNTMNLNQPLQKLIKVDLKFI